MIEICGRAPGRVANADQVTMGCVCALRSGEQELASNDFSAIPSQLLLDSCLPDLLLSINSAQKRPRRIHYRYHSR